jgi:Molybdenum cofactor biosynthesis enzyme
MLLTDQFNRKVNYLRVSVTDRCDLRCVYCMKEKMTFLPKNEILTLEEIERLCDNFIDLGINKIRLTGGEPLVRRNIITLINKLNLKKKNTLLKEITLTTNGSLLETYARDLKKSGINRINVSLDTIDENKYNQITRFGNLKKVILGINETKKTIKKLKSWLLALKNFNGI